MKFFYENKGLSIAARFGKNLAFGAHLHNHIELVYMLEGRTKAYVDFEEYIVCSGDVLIVFPNKIHQYQKIDNENYFISIFPQDLCPELSHIFKNKVPVSPLIRNASENKKIVPLLKDIVEANANNTSFGDTLLKGYYMVLLSTLFNMMRFEEAKATNSDSIKAILNYCAVNYDKDIKLETVSRELHISKYYISHIFSDKLHTGFKEYIGMLRISDACKLLKNRNMSITEAAYSVGFNSTRSFNRAFLKCTGMTPRQYKNREVKQ